MRLKSPPFFIFFALILAIILFCGWTLKQQFSRRQHHADNYEQIDSILLIGLLILAIISIGTFIYFLLP